MRLNGTGELIDAFEYPATSEDLIEAHGTHTIELQNGSETLAEVLGRIGPEVYETPRDAKDAVLCGVGHQAIGRRFYSDRDAPACGETGPKQLSF